jgi:conjugative transfer signal peptidase TraF
MKRILTKIVQGITRLLMGFLLIFGVLWALGGRINTSNSIPIGLYWLSKKPVAHGEYVLFCPPKTAPFQEAFHVGYIGVGFCDSGFGVLMKQVAALQGDRISVSDTKVTVNGVARPFSRPLLEDTLGRALPYFRVKDVALDDKEVLLMTDQSCLSFDARYFGLIHLSQVKSVIIPVITWPRSLY